jgi:hypothetical protein
MTRTVALAIWAVLAGLLVACEFLSLLTRRRLAGLLETTTRISATPALRVALLLGWMWLGWHFFAR